MNEKIEKAVDKLLGESEGNEKKWFVIDNGGDDNNLQPYKKVIIADSPLNAYKAQVSGEKRYTPDLEEFFPGMFDPQVEEEGEDFIVMSDENSGVVGVRSTCVVASTRELAQQLYDKHAKQDSDNDEPPVKRTFIVVGEMSHGLDIVRTVSRAGANVEVVLDDFLAENYPNLQEISRKRYRDAIVVFVEDVYIIAASRSRNSAERAVEMFYDDMEQD